MKASTVVTDSGAAARVSPAAAPRPKQKLAALQALRGLAAVLVVFHHASDAIETQPALATGARTFWSNRLFDTDIGAIGVDIFFMLSGFIMVYTTNARTTPLSFLTRRLTRIFPLFWAVSIILLLAHATPWFERINGNLEMMVKSIFLYPCFGAENRLIRPVILPQGWTLIYELYFYGLFAATLWLALPKRIFALTAYFAVTVVLACHSASLSPEIEFLRSPLVFEFVAGMGVAWLWQKSPSLFSRRVCGALIGIALSWMVAVALIRHPFDHQRLLVFGIPALLIMLGAAAPAVNNLRIPRWASFLGDASYSIYLIHILVLDTFQVGYLRIHALRALPFDLYYAILVSTAIIAGVVTYLLIEKPLLNLRPKRAASSTVRLSPATTT